MSDDGLTTIGVEWSKSCNSLFIEKWGENESASTARKLKWKTKDKISVVHVSWEKSVLFAGSQKGEILLQSIKYRNQKLMHFKIQNDSILSVALYKDSFVFGTDERYIKAVNFVDKKLSETLNYGPYITWPFSLTTSPNTSNLNVTFVSKSFYLT